ncbi:hypothetical protein EHS25_000321 [Saitozyma podzolica]|uniref:Uncharacterized protein n=1 Tax=Saitozyma podzolica TaxID=1890683 RepID=A0A427YW44_9TREE|nr:hypothetical protein EHS25_000321 [Saitozyma podzolica]
MLQPPPSSSQCSTTHDFTSTALTCVILVGLVISYLPQLIRIVRNGTSEGFSPWYLLLGATSSASAMLNILVVQWPIFQCCRVVSAGTCFESLLGFVQVFMQWFLFSGM